MPTGVRILIVDDDESVRETIGFTLGQAGYQCLAVHGGAQALELLNCGEKIDLVTTDITNAPIDGVKLLERLKDNFSDIPVLIITGRQECLATLECCKTGACDFVLKPFKRDQLLEAVHIALKRRHSAV